VAVVVIVGQIQDHQQEVLEDLVAVVAQDQGHQDLLV
jgi:hypothetical protein